MLTTDRIRNLAIAAGILFLATGCGSDADLVATDPTPTEVVSSSPTEVPTEIAIETATAPPAPTGDEPTSGSAEPAPEEPAPEPAAESTGEPTEPAARAVRLCTLNIEAGEVLNVRSGPSTDDPVIARVQSRSCAMTTPTASDAPWLPVRFETGQVRVDGYVSNNFVEVAAADNVENIAIEWVQAVLDGRDRSEWEYGPDLADVAFTRMELELRGGRAVPYIGAGDDCTFAGDVLVVCTVQVNDADGWEAGQFQVSVTGIGFNGYGPEFFPEDFGDLPLVTGLNDCGLFRQSCEPSNWQTIAVDSEASLLGVPLGSETQSAIARLTQQLGAPSEDTDWITGCPFDGDQPNERFVEWGALTVGFLRDSSAGSPEGFWYWSYDFSSDRSDANLQSQIRLPGQLLGNATLTEIGEAARLPIEDHELLAEPVIYGPGWTLLGRQNGDLVELTRAGVPYIPICD